MNTISSFCSVLLLLLLLTNIPEVFSYMTYDIVGGITLSDADQTPPIEVGDNFTGSITYQYNTDLDFFNHSNNHALYSGNFGSMNITVGSHEITADIHLLWVDNGSLTTSPDIIALLGGAYSPTLPGTEDLWLIFNDSSGTIFSDVNLPTKIDFSRFNTGGIATDDVHERPIGGDILSISPAVSAVPEPGTIILLSFSLLSFAGYYSHQHK